MNIILKFIRKVIILPSKLSKYNINVIPKLTASEDKTTQIINNKLLGMINKIKEIFINQYSLSSLFFINAPLEESDLILISFKNNLIQISSYGLSLSYFALYFIFTLFIIFTTKVIADSHLSIEFVKKFPLGKIIYFFLNRLLTIWSKNNIIWIYFAIIMISILNLTMAYLFYVTHFILT